MAFTYLTVQCPNCHNANYVRSVPDTYLQTNTISSPTGSAPTIYQVTSTTGATGANFFHCDNCQAHYIGVGKYEYPNAIKFPANIPTGEQDV